jgi:hypothetical protein
MKMFIRLNYFEKLKTLTLSQVRYLRIYRKRAKKEPITLERIGTILRKSQLDKDPILDFDYSLKLKDLYCKKNKVSKSSPILTKEPNRPRTIKRLREKFNSFNKKITLTGWIKNKFNSFNKKKGRLNDC